MPKLRVTSPARSQGDIATPKRKKSRGSRSLCSPALSTASGRLTSLVDQFKDKNMESFALSPLNGRSVLTDDTDIQEPRRKSWWKKLNENSQDVMEVLEDNKVTEANDIIEEFIDIEVLSQEKKNFTLDLPDSSDNESINSIVLPQRKLFTQKENQPQKKFGQLGGNRETLAKLHKTNTTNIDKTVNVGTRELFQNKRSKPVFPAALLNMSPNRTAADKTKENLLAEPKPQVRNIFGNRPANKRKNMFADFIVSESEDEIPEIRPKVFGFQKKVEQRRASSVSKGRDHSPTSSITTDMEMDDWRLLPSSTMVENQLEEMVAGHTPVKRARLSKLSEAKESEAGTNTIQSNLTADKTKQSNKSVSSKNKSRTSPSKETLETSRTTRSMTKNTSKCEEINTSTKKPDTKVNKSQNKTANKDKELEVSSSEKSLRHNRSKTRNSLQIMDNEIISDETNAANAINNATRVINKSTSKKLSNSQVTNKSLKEINKESDDNEETNIEAQNISNEQIMEDDDENNLTLEYDGDEKEEVIVQKLQNSHKENFANQNNSIKNTTKVDITKSRSQANELNQTLIQKQKQSKTVEESVESQQSTQDNVDGNLEHEPDTEQHENILDDSENKQSNKEANVSQTVQDANEKMGSKANASAKEDDKIVYEKSDDSHNNNQIEQEADVSHNDDNQVGEVQDDNEQNEEEVNESQEIEDENNISHEADQEIENGAIVSEEGEADESQVIEKENSHASQENDDEANESQEEQDESKIEENPETDQEVNESQVIEEDKENESEKDANRTVEAVEKEAAESEEEAAESEEEAAESEEEAAESEEEAAESEIEAAESDVEAAESDVEAAESDEEAAESDVEAAESDEEAAESNAQAAESEEEAKESDEGEEDADESIQADDNESELINEEKQSQEVNESQEIDNEEENEDVNESANDDQQEDEDEASDESDRAIASDPEMSNDDNLEEMEVDDENDQASNEAVAESEPNESEPLEENTGQSTEEIEESPNVTHDTTGRNRKKELNKSPEAILHDKTNQMDSFTVKGRNTSVRKTKSMIKNLDIRPSLAPRDSIGSDGTRNSSAEGSGWDSHRTTRKTLRQTFGKDFTPRKSLRAMVMEKSAKRQTEMMDTHYVTAKFPQANSTELPEDSNRDVEDFEVSDHEVSKRTRQTTLEVYLQKMKQQNIEKKLKMEEAVRNSLKAPVRDTLSLFKVPSKPAPRRPKPTQTKPKKQIKSVIPFDELPSEVIEDMKYKPPKRFQPTNASWITKRLYKFLENKLEPNYDYKARVRAEKLVETIYHFAKDLRRHDVAPSDAVDVLKHELARLEVVTTHFEFYEFFHEFMPREVRVKVVPDIVNKIPLPRHGVFSAILRGNTVQG